MTTTTANSLVSSLTRCCSSASLTGQLVVSPSRARMLTAVCASTVYTDGALPMMVMLAILADGILMGATAPLAAWGLGGSRMARSLSAAWGFLSTLSLGNMLTQVSSVLPEFPQDVAVLMQGPGAYLSVMVMVLAVAGQLVTLQAETRK